MDDLLYVENKDERGVLEIALNRPQVHNAFNEDLIAQLTERFQKVNEQEDVRLVVLCGKGKSFSAGADLNWMKKMKEYTDKENYKDSVNLSRMFQVMNACEKPLIGKIQGAALGGGCGIVSVCDYVVAERDCRFGFTEVRLGLIPAVISPFVMAKIGESAARAFFLSGIRFNSDRAYHMGLVHHVCDKEKLDEETDQIVKSFLKAAPQAASSAKTLVSEVLHSSSEFEESLIDYTCRSISKIRISDEGQEGMDALLSKRLPNWIKEE